ncbi:MAG: hypothetical protein ABI874_13010 [Chloroflexota bacterium]
MTLSVGARAPSAAIGDDDPALAEAIHRTIAYADLFEQAIATAQITRYLDVSASAAAVQRALARYTGSRWLAQDGLYCLPGRQVLFARTTQRLTIAGAKWSRARRWAALMACVPFVRMIGVTGSLAMNNMAADADIDYLIVTARGHVWSTRLMLIAVVRLARLAGDELCPNYVLSTEALRIEDQSFFTARELRQMAPLYGLNVYKTMMALNEWSLRFLPGADSLPPSPPEIRSGKLAQIVKTLGEALLRTPWGDWWETREMRHKIARLQQLPGAAPPHVILSAEQCKGHFRGTHRSLATQFAERAKF